VAGVWEPEPVEDAAAEGEPGEAAEQVRQ
jgi:hypothetical protein